MKTFHLLLVISLQALQLLVKLLWFGLVFVPFKLTPKNFTLAHRGYQGIACHPRCHINLSAALPSFFLYVLTNSPSVLIFLLGELGMPTR